MNVIEKSFPIKSVTIYPQIARITRSLGLNITKGQNKLIINNLPESLTEDSIRIEFEENSKFKIIDIFSVDDYKEIFDENLFRKKESELRSLIDKKDELEITINNLTDEFLLFLNKKKLLDGFDRKKFKPIDVNTWDDFFAFLNEKLKVNRDSFREILFEWIDLEQKIIFSENNLEKYRSYDQIKEHKIISIIESDIETSENILIHYLQPDVKWHPAYTLRADIEKKLITINLYAMITQTTGEDWENVDILLSTAIPLQNCDIPQIRSKRIKEKEAEIINIPAASPPYESRSSKKEALSILANTADDCIEEIESSYEEALYEKEEMSKQALNNSGAGLAYGGGAMASPAMRREKASNDTVLGDYPEEQTEHIEEEPGSINKTQRDNDLFQINNLISNIDKKILPYFSLDSVTEYYYDLFNYLQCNFNPEELVSVSSPKNINQVFLNEIPLFQSLGGYDYRYPIKSKKNQIPSVNIPTQIGVDIKELPIDLIYITIPVEKEVVFLKANFSNRGDNPFPAGPAQVFLENNLLGDIILPTLGQNEGTSLSLGIDKNIKVIRRENKKKETKGLVGKEMVTNYEIEIELISYKKEIINIEIVDRIPKTSTNDITIFNENYNTKPSKVTLRKILLWNTTLEPGKKKIIKYSYSIKHPENFQLTKSYDGTPYYEGEEEEK